MSATSAGSQGLPISSASSGRAGWRRIGCPMRMTLRTAMAEMIARLLGRQRPQIAIEAHGRAVQASSRAVARIEQPHDVPVGAGLDDRVRKAGPSQIAPCLERLRRRIGDPIGHVLWDRLGIY